MLLSCIASPEEQALFAQRLLPLLARQTALYTMGESTSVPTEIAERLLASVCFTLGAKDAGRLRALLAVPDWEAELARGRRRIEAQTRYGKALWQMLCQNLPPIQNDAMLDTLQGIGVFFHRYDIRYFSADIPMPTLIDYPLSSPVPETLEGIAYINEFLRRFALEACLLRLFSAKALARLMDEVCPDWKTLPVSLYLPVADQAIGLALAGRAAEFWVSGAPWEAAGEGYAPSRGAAVQNMRPLPCTALFLSERDRARIAARLEPLPRLQALQMLDEAAAALCRHPALKSPAQRRYLSRHAQNLYPRLEAALPRRTLEGIFFTISDREHGR